jgi:hypothetical protein
LKFRDVAQFRYKYAVACALEAKMQIGQFARFAQNYAVRLSEIVRKKKLSRNALVRVEMGGAAEMGLVACAVAHNSGFALHALRRTALCD